MKIATIPGGQTDSNIVDLGIGNVLVGVLPRTGFDGTTLSFAVGEGPVTGPVSVMNTGAGGAFSKTVAANQYTPLDPKDFYGVRFVRLTAASQTGDGIVALFTRPMS